jgi:hypothetical protein
MRKLHIVLIMLAAAACGKGPDIDTEKPAISLGFAEAFPQMCDTLYFGDTVWVAAEFSDNYMLGSKNAMRIDIHHNFDHHSHSTEAMSCLMDNKKEAVNPFVHIAAYDIPAGLKHYRCLQPVALPLEADAGAYCSGDYHMMLSVTDKEGWSSMKGISIKILAK